MPISRRAVARIRTTCLATIVAVLAAGASGAATAPELFGAAARAFQAQDWQETRAKVDELFALAPTLPLAERTKLVPPALFLRASSLAMLGEDDAARDALVVYVLLVPGAAADPEKMPKKVVKAFERARRDRDDLDGEYAAFRALPDTFEISGAALANGPLRLVLSNEQLAELRAADAAGARLALAGWLAAASGDPAGAATTVTEVLERQAFADLAFGGSGTPGSTSDRATVFALLGPPSLVRHPIVKDNQAAQAHVGDAPSMGESLRSEGIESWVYRADRTPPWFESKGVELNFQIDRRRGTWTLEKMFPAPMLVEGAAKHLRETGTL